MYIHIQSTATVKLIPLFQKHVTSITQNLRISIFLHGKIMLINCSTLFPRWTLLLCVKSASSLVCFRKAKLKKKKKLILE